MILWLVGMMGSGKTSAGKRAATNLGFSFVDVDAQIVAEEGRTVHEIFDSSGEEGFRQIESRVIARLGGSAQDLAGNAVVATGGGSVLSRANREIMRSTGRVIWLDGSPRTLAAHIGNESKRPLLDGVEDRDVALAALRAERMSTYEACADAVIGIDDLDEETVAAAIEEIWKTF